MIKIDTWFAPDLVQKYENKMLKKIKKHYRSNGLAKSIKNYFEKNGIFSEMKVRELLTGKITQRQIQSFPHISSRQMKKLSSFYSYSFLQNDEIRHELLASLRIQVCPYCNRQFITSFRSNGKINSTADLDHFYPKNTYPLLALSLYNFIPSCQICNSRMKLGRTDEIIYPYEEHFGDDAVFKVITANGKTETDDYVELLHSFMGLKNTEINLKIDVNSQSTNAVKIRNSIALFKLEEVYQSHTNYVRELLIKKRIYDDGSYFEMLSNQFSGIFGEFGSTFSESELDLFLYGFNWNNGEDPERPLSKLTYDIVKRE